MHLMQGLQIIQPYLLLFGPAPLLYPLKTAQGVGSQIDMSMEDGQLIELVEILVKPQVQFELHIVHFALLGQQSRKNLFVSHYTPLRKQVLLLRILVLQKMVQMVAPGQQCVVLEGVGPAAGVVVVGLQQIVILDLLPLVERFGGDGKAGESLGEQVQEYGFATADVALDGIDYSLHQNQWWLDLKEIVHNSLLSAFDPTPANKSSLSQ